LSKAWGKDRLNYKNLRKVVFVQQTVLGQLDIKLQKNAKKKKKSDPISHCLQKLTQNVLKI
jgi:hypothetical protein